MLDRGKTKRIGVYQDGNGLNLLFESDSLTEAQQAADRFKVSRGIK